MGQSQASRACKVSSLGACGDILDDLSITEKTTTLAGLVDLTQRLQRQVRHPTTMWVALGNAM